MAKNREKTKQDEKKQKDKKAKTEKRDLKKYIPFGKKNSEDGEPKIFDRVGDFFNYEPQKEKVLNKDDFKGAGDTYYAAVCAGYKVIERLLWLSLILFLTISVATNHKEITYSNVFYLLRDFSSVSDSMTSNYEILSYDSDSRQKFALYRGGIVTASPSTMSVFTAGGRRTLRNNTEYNSPNVISSDKYVMVYDTAGSAFSVYNSFAKVYNEKLDSPISYACFDNDGSFAVSTRTNNIKTVIYLYNTDMKQIGQCSDSRFMFSMSLDNSDKKLAALYYSGESGIGQTAVCVYDISGDGSKNKFIELTVDGEFPLACSFLENGHLAVVTNTSLGVYDVGSKELKLKEYVNFGGAEITAFDSSENGAAVAFSEGVKKTIVAVDKKGKTVYNSTTSENVKDIAVYGDYIFVHTVNGVLRIDTDNAGHNEFLESVGGTMLVYNEDTAIVCGEAKAEYLVFGKRQ